MSSWLRASALAPLLTICAMDASAAAIRETDPASPVVIAHRGDSAHLPEHTLAAYARAITGGADWIEPDLVATRDGVLVARHENEIGGTTDVATHPAFASRRRRMLVDGVPLEGWFVEDFSLAELRTLRARERLPDLRGTRHDGEYPIPTLQEIIALVATESRRHGRRVGLAPELKHPAHFRALGLPMEERLLAMLDAHPYTRDAPVAIQSFEVDSLRRLRRTLGGRENLQLVQLVGDAGPAPTGQVDQDALVRPVDILSRGGLQAIAGYADAIGPPLGAVRPVQADGSLGQATTLVAAAHASGLRVYPYTFRPENHYLPPTLRRGDDPRLRNPEGAIAHIRALLDAGIDGFFSDDVEVGRAAVDGWLPPSALTDKASLHGGATRRWRGPTR